jgi:hypothetical protein
MPIEMPVYVGARLAQWHRSYSSFTFGELLAKARRRLTRPLFLAYRHVLVAAFHARNILKRSAPIHAEAGTVSFRLMPQGAVAFDIWSGLRFERPELEFILKMLEPGMTFFDIGANVGVFSVAAGKTLQATQSRIYAFEPCPATFAILEKKSARKRADERPRVQHGGFRAQRRSEPVRECGDERRIELA